MKRERIGILLAVIFLGLGGIVSSGILGMSWKTITLPSWFGFLQRTNIPGNAASNAVHEGVKVMAEESVIIDVVEKASSSVVTIGIKKSRRVGDIFEINPFDPFGGFARRPGQTQQIEQDIGTGFIITSDGLIVTNKHVVGDADATYNVVTKDDKTFAVEKIYRDPTNDLAIIKINAQNLTPVELGDSSLIKVGQLAIAIGTALGEFRQTVTTGVISGVGRGITAGSPFESSVERLDNVIQTDAAINPGNSGGPLFNSAGQVVGVNTAVSSEGQNIGFAIPINVVKDALNNFNTTGQFNRPFLGIRYRTVTKDISVLNDVPVGAYILEVVPQSPADKAGLKEQDIITALDNVQITEENGELSAMLAKKKVGESVKLTVWRDTKVLELNAVLATQE